MMYHLDGRWRRQSLVYFGVSSLRPAFREALALSKYLVTANPCVLNLGHSFDAIEAYFLDLLVCRSR